MNTEHFPDIIREAAASPLGILALIILMLVVLALAFFRTGSERTRLTVWMMAFAGALLFGFAIVESSSDDAVREEIAGDTGADEGPLEEPPRRVDPGDLQQAGTAAVPPEVEPAPPARTQRATIQVGYTGDVYGCSLPLTIAVGDRSFQPQGNLAPLNGVPLGLQDYTVSGTILCPGIGQCEVDSEGTIHVAAGHTYYLAWQNTSFGQCEAMLQAGM